MWFIVITRKEITRFEGHTGIITSISFSKDGSKVATGSKDNTCHLWDVASFKELGVLSVHESNINSVSFSPDGTKLIAKDRKGTEKVWLVASVLELKGDQAPLEPQVLHHILDDITANYESKRVTLSQKVMASTDTSTSIQLFSIDFADEIKDIRRL